MSHPKTLIACYWCIILLASQITHAAKIEINECDDQICVRNPTPNPQYQTVITPDGKGFDVVRPFGTVRYPRPACVIMQGIVRHRSFSCLLSAHTQTGEVSVVSAVEPQNSTPWRSSKIHYLSDNLRLYGIACTAIVAGTLMYVVIVLYCGQDK